MSSQPNRDSSQADDFSSLIAQEQDFLKGLTRILGVPPADAPDVLQEANLYMIENQDKFSLGTNFRAWAAQILRYRVLNYFRLRKTRKENMLSEEAMETLSLEAVELHDVMKPRLQRLKQCLQRLNPKQAQLLAAVYRSKKNLKQLATESGQSHAALRKTISRIRIQLKKCIESDEQA